MNIITRLIIALLCVLGAAVMHAQASARPDLAAFADIDQQVANTPNQSTASVKSLAAHLSKLCNSDTEEARAIFCWISHNIAYDCKAAASGNYPDQSAECVLKTRKAVCGGYAYLFAALAEAMGLREQTIIGCSKGLRYVVSQRNLACDHAWNAVMLDGQWRLVDCAWGAGYIDEAGRFVRRRCDHYFLTPPEQFVYDHFPQEPKWQLLKTPVTRPEYEKLVYLRPEAFEHGLNPCSHRFGSIAAGPKLALSIATPENVVMTADVLSSADSEPCAGASTFIQRARGELCVSASFPKAGKYILRLFAKHKAEPGAYQWVLDYAIAATSGTAGVAAFPTAYPVFLERNACLQAPFQAALKPGGRELFKLTVPGAESVAVVVGSKFTALTKQGDQFAGEAEVSGEKVSVAAKFADSADYYVLLDYAVSRQSAASAAR